MPFPDLNLNASSLYPHSMNPLSPINQQFNPIQNVQGTSRTFNPQSSGLHMGGGETSGHGIDDDIARYTADESFSAALERGNAHYAAQNPKIFDRELRASLDQLFACAKDPVAMKAQYMEGRQGSKNQVDKYATVISMLGLLGEKKDAKGRAELEATCTQLKKDVCKLIDKYGLGVISPILDPYDKKKHGKFKAIQKDIEKKWKELGDPSAYMVVQEYKSMPAILRSIEARFDDKLTAKSIRELKEAGGLMSIPARRMVHDQLEVIRTLYGDTSFESLAQQWMLSIATPELERPFLPDEDQKKNLKDNPTIDTPSPAVDTPSGPDGRDNKPSDPSGPKSPLLGNHNDIVQIVNMGDIGKAFQLLIDKIPDLDKLVQLRVATPPAIYIYRDAPRTVDASTQTDDLIDVSRLVKNINGPAKMPSRLGHPIAPRTAEASTQTDDVDVAPQQVKNSIARENNTDHVVPSGKPRMVDSSTETDNLNDSLRPDRSASQFRDAISSIVPSPDELDRGGDSLEIRTAQTALIDDALVLETARPLYVPELPVARFFASSPSFNELANPGDLTTTFQMSEHAARSSFQEDRRPLVTSNAHPAQSRMHASDRGFNDARLSSIPEDSVLVDDTSPQDAKDLKRVNSVMAELAGAELETSRRSVSQLRSLFGGDGEIQKFNAAEMRSLPRVKNYAMPAPKFALSTTEKSVQVGTFTNHKKWSGNHF